jgi:hypothetical protein
MGGVYRNEVDALHAQCVALRRQLAEEREGTAELELLKAELEQKLAALQAARISQAEREIAAGDIRRKTRSRTVGATLAAVSIIAAGIAYLTSGDKASPESASTRSWFARIRNRCNAVEVALAVKQDPPPPGWRGSAELATCLSLANKVAEARSVLNGLPQEERNSAVTYLFQVVHPIADAGDDVAAGPVMEMVVEYQPQNFMATYHAGMSAFETRRPPVARRYLEAFLTMYSQQDGWRSRAQSALNELKNQAR